MTEAATSGNDLAGRLDALRATFRAVVDEALEDGLTPDEIATIKRISERIKDLEQAVEQASSQGPVHTTEAVIAGGGQAASDGSDPGLAPPPNVASIGGSVGQGGRNAPEDVQVVQRLLNEKGASPALDVDGQSGPKTVNAIAQFQQQAIGFADGRVDVGGGTWVALSGGSIGGAPPATGGPDDDLTHLIDDTPDGGGTSPFGETPPPGPGAEEIITGGGGGDEPGPPVEPTPAAIESTVAIGGIELKVGVSKDFNVVSVALEKAFSLPTLTVSYKIFHLSVTLTPLKVAFQASNLDRPGNVPTALTISTEASAELNVGVIKDDLKSAGGCKFGGALHSKSFKITINTEDIPASTGSIDDPIRFALKAQVSLVLEATIKGHGIKHEVPLAAYDNLAFIDIGHDLSANVSAGPGLDELEADVWKFLADASDPEKSLPGPESKGMKELEDLVSGKPKEIDSSGIDAIVDDATKIMVEQSELRLQQSHAALAAPGVVGGGNSMNKIDPSRAAQLYGMLWQQRTDAVNAAAAYVSFQASDSPHAKADEASALADACDASLQAWRAADAQWGYGQSSGGGGSGGGGGGGAIAQVVETLPEEADTYDVAEADDMDEGSVVDEVLDFFGFGDDDED